MFRGVMNCNEYRNCNIETKTGTKGEKHGIKNN